MTTTAFVDGSTLSAAAWANDTDTLTYNRLTTPAGTNTVTATGPASMTAYAAGQIFTFIPANTNTGATTLNITPSGGSALGAKNIFATNAACVGGEIRQNVPVMVWYDGTQFQIIGNGAFANIAAVPDNLFAIQDNGDRTKQGAFQLSGVDTGTTRTLTWPNQAGTIAVTTDITGGTLAGSFTTLAASSTVTVNDGNVVLNKTNSNHPIIWQNNTAEKWRWQNVGSSSDILQLNSANNGTNVITATQAGTLAFPNGIYVGATQTAAALISQASSGAGTTTCYIGNQSITTSSDERIKTNVRVWDGDASAILKALPVKAWDAYTQDAPQGGYEGGYVGFTAQDLHKVAPWAVNTQGDTGLPWQARYEFLNGIIVKGWQNHESQIQALLAWNGKAESALSQHGITLEM